MPMAMDIWFGFGLAFEFAEADDVLWFGLGLISITSLPDIHSS